MKEPSRRTKVVIRHLPPSVTQSILFSHIDDRFSDCYNWFSFRLGKFSHKHQRYSRAYINFNRPEDVFEFAEFFDGHIFVNEKGTQFKAIVEYAPSQRVPKPDTKKDGREGTILKDPDYLEFLKLIAKPVENLPSAEVQLERKEAELSGAPKETSVVTPLMEFVRHKRALGSGTQGSVTLRKVGKKATAASTGKPGTSNKHGSKKKKYILKDCAKGGKKSKFVAASKREERPATSVTKELRENGTVYGIDGPVTGVTLTADSGKQKFLLLKPKDREASRVPEGLSEQQGASSTVANSPGSIASRQNQRREAGEGLIRSILLSNDAGQGQSSVAVQPQQKTEIMSSDNVKRPPRPTNARLGMNDHVSNIEIPVLKSDDDKKRASDDKFIKKKLHGSGPGGEKHEKRTRNKDRPDRGVWAPLRRSNVSRATEERLSSSILQSAQASSNSIEVTEGEVKVETTNGRSRRNIPSENGSHRHFDRHPAAHNIKDDGSFTSSDGKSSKKGATGPGAHEKQVWVQKSSSGS